MRAPPNTAALIMAREAPMSNTGAFAAQCRTIE